MPEDEEIEDAGAITPHEVSLNDSTAMDALRVFSDRIEDIEFFDAAQFAWVPIGESWHLKLAADRVTVRKSEEGFLVVAQNGGEIFNLSSRSLPLNYLRSGRGLG